MKTTAFGVVAGLAVLVSGCTLPSSKRVVSQREAGHMQRIEYGTIQKVNEVVIEGQRGPIGTYGGAATGVAATSEVGHGAGRDLAQVGGGIAGAVAGQAVEEAVTRKNAREMVIKLDNGDMVLVTQDSPPEFGVGDRVAVASGAGGAHVMAP